MEFLPILVFPSSAFFWGHIMHAPNAKSPNQYLTSTQQYEQTKHTLQAAFLKQWVDSKVDALLMPVLPWVGYKPKTWVKSKQWLGYTAMWNLLDYAAVTVPVARADRDLDSVGGSGEWGAHSMRNESDAFNYLQCKSCADIDIGVFGTRPYANIASR